MAPNRNITTMNVMTNDETTKLFSLINELRVRSHVFIVLSYVSIIMIQFNAKKFGSALRGKTIALVGIPEVVSMTCQRAISEMGGQCIMKNCIGSDV